MARWLLDLSVRYERANATAQIDLELVPQASCLHRQRGTRKLEACGTKDTALSRSLNAQ